MGRDGQGITDDEFLAQAAVGNMAMSLMDGSLKDLDQETMLEMAGALEAAPHVAAGFVMGQDLMGKNDGSLDGAGLHRSLMNMYYGAQFTGLQESMDAETEEAERRRRVDHLGAVYSYSRMSPDDVARAEWDAENGDSSLMIRAEERFYLG